LFLAKPGEAMGVKSMIESATQGRTSLWRMTLGLVSVLLFASCTPAPARPAPGTAAEPAAVPDWQAQWEEALAAARQEGKVVIAGPPGQSFRDAALEFNKRYPGITAEYAGAPGRDQVPKIVAERRAGQYFWDVWVGGGPSAYSLKAEGSFDPIRPALILPEVVDDSQWFGGFDDGYVDKDKRFVYGFTGFLGQHVVVNRDVIPESELNSVEQLIEPRWQGKLSWQEPRAAGAGSALAAYLLIVKGEDWLRKLLEQDIVVSRDGRQQLEWVVQNRYPIGLGPDQALVVDFRRKGFLSQLQWLDPDSPLGSRLTTSFGNVAVFNRAPHPNAARVFLNWLLSPEGQAAWVAHIEQNSRRLDIPGPPESALRPGARYINPSTEENTPYTDRAIELAKSILK
jgi:iron(III) transport system substrate-binding protein